MKQIQCNVLDHLKQAQIEQVWLYVRDSQNYTATIQGHWTTNLQIVLNTPTKFLPFKSSHPHNSPTQTESQKQNFQTQKNPSIIPSHIIRSTPPEGMLRRRPSE